MDNEQTINFEDVVMAVISDDTVVEGATMSNLALWKAASGYLNIMDPMELVDYAFDFDKMYEETDPSEPSYTAYLFVLMLQEDIFGALLEYGLITQDQFDPIHAWAICRFMKMSDKKLAKLDGIDCVHVWLN